MDQMTIQSSEMTRETIPLKTIETRLKNSSVQIDDYSTTSQQYEIILFKNNKFKLGNGYFSRDEILGRQEKIIGVYIDKTTGLQNTVTSLQKDISDMFLNTVGMSKDLHSANTTFDNSRFNPVTSESRNYTSIKEDDAIVRGNVNTDYLKRRSIIQRNSKKANELQSKLPNHIGQSSMTNVRVSEEHLKDKITNHKEEQSVEDTSIYLPASRIKSKSQKIRVNTVVTAKKKPSAKKS